VIDAYRRKFFSSGSSMVEVDVFNEHPTSVEGVLGEALSDNMSRESGHLSALDGEALSAEEWRS
jgi:hypothetical protein